MRILEKDLHEALDRLERATHDKPRAEIERMVQRTHELFRQYVEYMESMIDDG